MTSVKEIESHGPVMDSAWRKRTSLMEANHMIAARADGTISKWRSDQPWEEVENVPLNRSNQYMTCDFSSLNRIFAIAGSLPQIELYDMEDMRLLQQLGEKVENKSKIFTVRYFPGSYRELYSGGWDCNVKFWDVRSNK